MNKLKGLSNKIVPKGKLVFATKRLNEGRSGKVVDVKTFPKLRRK